MSLFETTKHDKFELLLSDGSVKSFSFTPENSQSMDEARRKKDAFRRDYEERAEKTAGRPITKTEWAAGRIASAKDSRDFARRMRDEKFSAKPRDARTAVEKEIERQEKKVEEAEYKQLSLDERRLRDLQEYQAKQEAEQDAKMNHASRLAKYSNTLDKLKARQNNLRWRTDTDESEWQTLNQAIRLIETEGSDLRALKPRLEELSRLDETRKLNRRAALEQEQEVLAARMRELEEDTVDDLDAEIERLAAEEAKHHAEAEKLQKQVDTIDEQLAAGASE